MEKVNSKGFMYYFFSVVSTGLILSAIFLFGRFLYYFYFDYSVTLSIFDIAIIGLLILFALLFTTLMYTQRSLTLQTATVELLLHKNEVKIAMPQMTQTSQTSIISAKSELEELSKEGHKVNQEMDSLNGRIEKVRQYLNEID